MHQLIEGLRVMATAWWSADRRNLWFWLVPLLLVIGIISLVRQW